MGTITRSVNAEILSNVIAGYKATLPPDINRADCLQVMYGTHDALVPDAIRDGKKIGRDDDGSGSINYALYCFGWLVGEFLKSDSKDVTINKEKALESIKEINKHLGQLSSVLARIKKWEVTKECSCDAPRNDILNCERLTRWIAGCLYDLRDEIAGVKLDIDLSDKNPYCC